MLSFICNKVLELLGYGVSRIFKAGLQRHLFYFPFISEFLSVLPFSLGWKLRKAIYTQLLGRIGEDVVLHFGVTIEDPRTEIGNDVWVSRNCYLDYVKIGNSVLIGPHAVLLSGGQQHNSDRIDIPIKRQGNNPKQSLFIGDGAWIGANAVVMADVGHDAIVSAGAVVYKPVPPFAVVTGNPARVVRLRTDDTSSPEKANEIIRESATAGLRTRN